MAARGVRRREAFRALNAETAATDGTAGSEEDTGFMGLLMSGENRSLNTAEEARMAGCPAHRRRVTRTGRLSSLGVILRPGCGVELLQLFW